MTFIAPARHTSLRTRGALPDFIFLSLCLLVSFQVLAQQLPQAARQFPVGALQRLEDLPPGHLRDELNQLPVAARDRGIQWLRTFHFTTLDLQSLHADRNGNILYACNPVAAELTTPSDTPVIEQAAVPVAPFPANLVFHSRPGAPNVLYINFCGETVVNSEWNTVVGRAEIPAVPFSLDSDLATFSDAEQLAIKRVWQRIAEDYAPFNIDVTTERPATFGNRTAHALITRTTDATGQTNPYYDSGGVAYVNVFGTTSYSRYRPAWIYHNNLGDSEANIAEAASHEIGHNMGLSHDGKTDGTEYYGGHGSGDTSWGPLMGTGYYRNVSQWSKGEYYLANNTQDDLATIAGKLTYRTDDHGGTPGTATPLVVTGTNILVTTPENDASNNSTANKGVLERNTDVDVFSFVTGNGPVSISIRPWVSPANSKGGNLDLLVSLYNDAGVLLLTNNTASLTTAMVLTNLTEGRYYLHIANTGAYNPLQSPSTGYTAYGSIGQYFISGYVSPANVYVAPPIAELRATDLTTPGVSAHTFSVSYTDNAGIAVSTIDNNDVQVTGPNGFDALAQLVSVDIQSDGTPRLATYSIKPPAGQTWTPMANGTYAVWMNTNQVRDVEGSWVASGQIGTFNVAVPAVLYSANMDVDPGWVLEAPWEYGTPSYGSGGPTGGYTGTRIIALNLGGNYANDQPVKYATTPAINCSGAGSLTLRFKRWLQTRSQDSVAVQVSTTPNVWTNLWSTSAAVTDTSWQDLQYALPAEAAGNPSVRFRWSLSSNKSQNSIGWNIDDVELLAGGDLDSMPPSAALSVANVTSGGSPTHPCSVTYSDNTAVKLSSLGADLVVTGPGGYSNVVEFTGADLPDDGTPVTATYSIPAPGGSWDAPDNGTYSITLLENEVSDIYNNTCLQTNLGTFTVSISTVTPGPLSVTPAWGLDASIPSGASLSPALITYTLSNPGEAPLNWSVTSAAPWLTIEPSEGSLTPGTSTSVTVTVNAQAALLSAGTYSDLLNFANSTTGLGNTTRPVSLTVTPPPIQLVVEVNNPEWGSVNISSNSYPAGSTVQVLASPNQYYQFNRWTGTLTNELNPINVVLESDTVLRANFSEVTTTNTSTPLWWLASQGYTNDLETAANLITANGMPLWQSYIAGLNPNDPNSRFEVTGATTSESSGFVLEWNTVTGRVYTIWQGSSPDTTFEPLPGAVQLPAGVHRYTNDAPNASQRFYRLEVQKP